MFFGIFLMNYKYSVETERGGRGVGFKMKIYVYCRTNKYEKKNFPFEIFLDHELIHRLAIEFIY